MLGGSTIVSHILHFVLHECVPSKHPECLKKYISAFDDFFVGKNPAIFL